MFGSPVFVDLELTYTHLKVFSQMSNISCEKKNHFRHDHIRNLALGSCDLNLTAEVCMRSLVS